MSAALLSSDQTLVSLQALAKVSRHISPSILFPSAQLSSWRTTEDDTVFCCGAVGLQFCLICVLIVYLSCSCAWFFLETLKWPSLLHDLCCFVSCSSFLLVNWRFNCNRWLIRALSCEWGCTIPTYNDWGSQASSFCPSCTENWPVWWVQVDCFPHFLFTQVEHHSPLQPHLSPLSLLTLFFLFSSLTSSFPFIFFPSVYCILIPSGTSSYFPPPSPSSWIICLFLLKCAFAFVSLKTRLDCGRRFAEVVCVCVNKLFLEIKDDFI